MTTAHKSAAKVTQPEGKKSDTRAPLVLPRVHIPLYPSPKEGSSWHRHLTKAQTNEAAKSNQGTQVGRKMHPFNMAATTRFMTANTHHSACISAKVAASVGLGIEDDAAVAKLDELCEVSWHSLIASVAEDLESNGNGYIEVVRSGSRITGLHHIAARGVYVEVDDPQTLDHHFTVYTEEHAEKHFARFGDAERFQTSTLGQSLLAATKQGGEASEVIHIKEPGGGSRWYGIPKWLSAVAAVELVMCVMQHNYDFFNNRGVPEFALFVTGGTVSAQNWEELQARLFDHVGLGNSRKSLALNIPGEVSIQLERLAMDAKDEGSFETMLDTLAMMIVTGHQVPPQLAGIMIPGKLGATNELPNAMATFQAMVMKQKQLLWQSVLGCTLGKEGLGVDGINKDTFKWRTITDEINLPALEATSRTRTPLAEGEPEPGRGPKGGKRPPEAGSPAARLAEMRKSTTPAERIAAVTDLFEEMIYRAIAEDAE